MDIETKSVELLDKFEALATQYTPEVIDAAEAAVRVTAISNLVYGVIAIATACGTCFLATKATSFFIKRREEDGPWSDWEIGIVLSAIIGVVSGTVFTLSGVTGLFSLWNWVAIFNPQLALAHKILGL